MFVLCVVGGVSVHNSILQLCVLCWHVVADLFQLLWYDVIVFLCCVVCVGMQKSHLLFLIWFTSFVTLVVYHRASNYDVAGVCHDCVHPSHPFILSYHFHSHLHFILAQLSFVVFVNYVTSVIDMCSCVLASRGGVWWVFHLLSHRLTSVHIYTFMCLLCVVVAAYVLCCYLA